MLKVCLIGLGKMGSNHIRVLHELQEENKIKLLSIVDIHEEIAKEIGKKYNVPYCVDYRVALKEKPDVVIIVVPTKSHFQVAYDAIMAGCHVFIEKPITSTILEAKRLLKLAEWMGIKVMVGHIERFNPVVQYIKEQVHDKKINLIGIVRVGPISSQDVGVILDLGVHDIDIIRYLSGSEFKTMKVLANNRHIISGIEKSSVILFEMNNGVMAYLVTNTITPIKVRRIEVTTENEFIYGDFISQKITEYSQGEVTSQSRRSMFVTEVDMPYIEPLKAELKAFIKSIEEGKETPITGKDGLKAIEVAMKCLKQLNKNHVM